MGGRICEPGEGCNAIRVESWGCTACPPQDPNMDLETEELIAAILAGDGVRVDFLLDAHPKLAESRNAEGVSVVMLAIYNGRREMAAKIATRKQRLNIFEAAALGQTETLKQLLASDAMHLRGTSPDGFPALHLAA